MRSSALLLATSASLALARIGHPGFLSFEICYLSANGKTCGSEGTFADDLIRNIDGVGSSGLTATVTLDAAMQCAFFPERNGGGKAEIVHERANFLALVRAKSFKCCPPPEEGIPCNLNEGAQ